MIKTIVTIGPNSLSKKDIDEFAKHTSLFRLNGSHSDLEWHRRAIKLIRGACPQAFILMDIPGIKPRTKNQKNIKISKGDEIVFGKATNENGLIAIDLTKPLPSYNCQLTKFSLNDGQFLFDVTQTGSDFIAGRSRESFTLLPKKGINLPGSIYDEEKQFEIYQSFIKEIKDLKIDALGLSFVQTGELVERIRKLRPELVLVSKVENTEGLINCSDISTVSDAVMIDRGDLVAEIGYERLFSAIEDIVNLTKAYGKPLIMATENLESMIDRELPSKSEVISIAHSAKIGTDCFMLSEETALSDNKHIILNWLSTFLKDLAPHNIRKNIKTTDIFDYKSDIWESVSRYPNIPALIMSKSGRAITKYLSQAQNTNLFLLTNNAKVVKIAQLYSHDITVFEKTIDDLPTIEILWKVINNNKLKIFEKNDKVLAIYVSKYSKTPRANTITIMQKDDFC
jgi:pyruvate kinase